MEGTWNNEDDQDKFDAWLHEKHRKDEELAKKRAEDATIRAEMLANETPEHKEWREAVEAIIDYQNGLIDALLDGDEDM